MLNPHAEALQITPNHRSIASAENQPSAARHRETRASLLDEVVCRDDDLGHAARA
jgi:hypothetical protein